MELDDELFDLCRTTREIAAGMDDPILAQRLLQIADELAAFAFADRTADY